MDADLIPFRNLHGLLFYGNLQIDPVLPVRHRMIHRHGKHILKLLPHESFHIRMEFLPRPGAVIEPGVAVVIDENIPRGITELKKERFLILLVPAEYLLMEHMELFGLIIIKRAAVHGLSRVVPFCHKRRIPVDKGIAVPQIRDLKALNILRLRGMSVLYPKRCLPLQILKLLGHVCLEIIRRLLLLIRDPQAVFPALIGHDLRGSRRLNRVNVHLHGTHKGAAACEKHSNRHAAKARC